MMKRIGVLQGATLIELLVSTAISMLVLTSIGSFYVSLQRNASEHSQQLILNQALSTAVRRIQSDLTRSGFHELKGSALIPSGASATVHVSMGGTVVQYAYWDSRKPDEATPVENVVWQFDRDKQKLLVCRTVSSLAQGSKDISYSSTSGCTSVFEPNLVAVTDFRIISNQVGTASASNQYLQLNIVGELRGNPSVAMSLQRDFMVRNGQ